MFIWDCPWKRHLMHFIEEETCPNLVSNHRLWMKWTITRLTVTAMCLMVNTMVETWKQFKKNQQPMLLAKTTGLSSWKPATCGSLKTQGLLSSFQWFGCFLKQMISKWPLLHYFGAHFREPPHPSISHNVAIIIRLYHIYPYTIL